MYSRNLAGNVSMEFLMYSHYVGTLEDWIERVQNGLKNEMKGGLFGNHGVDVDSMTVIRMYISC